MQNRASVIERRLASSSSRLAIVPQPGVELAQPLPVDERLEDPAHLVAGRAAAQPAQEAEIDDLGEVAVDGRDQPRLVAAVGQEDAHQLDELVAAEHQPGVGADGVELGELLAQQGQQQADWKDSERRGTSRGTSSPVSVDRATAQVGVALRLVDDHLQPEHGDVVADRGPQSQQLVPDLLVAVAVARALEQLNQDRASAR